MASIEHMAYHCPGLHDDTPRICEPRSGSEELSGGRILIPIFQRRYCWDSRLVKQVVADAMGAHMGRHSLGRVVHAASSGDDGALLCIDGQQRITTMSLIFAAIRDEAADIGGGDDVVDACNAFLFVDRGAAEAWRASGELYAPGADVPFVRLSPSWPDRDAYFGLVLGAPHTDDGAESGGGGRATESSVPAAYAAARAAAGRVMAGAGGSAEAGLGRLRTMVGAVGGSLSVVHYEMGSDEHVFQTFLWLQERGMLGAALVHNPKPGIGLAACDLVRNYILALGLRSSAADQTRRYREEWLPLDTRFETPAAFDAFLAALAPLLPPPPDDAPKVELPPTLVALASNIRTMPAPDWSALRAYYTIATWINGLLFTAADDAGGADGVDNEAMASHIIVLLHGFADEYDAAASRGADS